MAEQLIIHVKIDGFSPQKETGKGGGSATTAAADKIGTYSPNTAPNGTHTYVLWYLVEDPTLIGVGGA